MLISDGGVILDSINVFPFDKGKERTTLDIQGQGILRKRENPDNVFPRR
jgi:hypothetical protein